GALGYAGGATPEGGWARARARRGGRATRARESAPPPLGVKDPPRAAPAESVAAIAPPRAAPAAGAEAGAPAPAATPPPPPAAAASFPPPAAAGDPVETRVLAIVAEKTGYPPDMLALDLDLAADL